MPQTDVARLLEEWNEGDPNALAELMPLVLNDLRATARRYFQREDSDHTLQPTALVNELYLRLHECRSVHWESPGHFFGAAAQMMRRLLIDHARLRQAAKRGGDAVKVPLLEELHVRQHDPEEILAFHEVLERLRAMDSRQAEIVELRFFAGLKNHEIAKILGVGMTLVKKELRVARAWMKRELRGDSP